MDNKVSRKRIERFKASLRQTVEPCLLLGVRIADQVNGTTTDLEKILKVLVGISNADFTLIPTEAQFRMKYPNAKNVQADLNYCKLLDKVMASIFLAEYTESI